MKGTAKKKGTGFFVISLDFELFWGVRDKRTITSYGQSLRNVKKVIPRLLEVFNAYDLRVTFATVGLLFAKNKEEMLEYTPKQKPAYTDRHLSPYEDGFKSVGEHMNDDPYHYALDLIHSIQQHPQHEISTHTYSHYYGLEEGQTKEDFKADLQAAIAIASKENVELKTIVFPRNQYNAAYAPILGELGIVAYRGKERIWFQSYENENDTSLLKKMFRTADCYLNLSGHHTYALEKLAKGDIPYDIPSSRFLRPYQKKLSFLGSLQLRRIKRGMTHAAKLGHMYHLWWHPHNFGTNMDENFQVLDAVLAHYKQLNQEYGFQSKTMKEVADMIQSV